MNIDDVAKLVTIALVLAHLAALIAVLGFHARFQWIVWLNLLVSAGALLGAALF